MELLNLTVGLILGIMIKDLTRVYRLYLSFFTVFIILKIFNPELKLLPIDEWTIHNLINGYNFWWYGILSFSLVMLFFYYIIPLLLKKTIIDNLVAYYSKWLEKQTIHTHQYIEKLIIRIILLVMSFRDKIFFKKNEINKNKNIKDYEIHELLISVICIYIHSVVVFMYFITYFSFGAKIYICLLCLLTITYFILYTPFWTRYIFLINESINNYSNYIDDRNNKVVNN